MKTTIKDVAKESSVSVTTVSLVLNNKPCRVNEETRLRVIETAKRLNYQPSVVAKGLVTKKTYTLGLIIPDLENLFFSALAKGLEEECLKQGYMLLILNSNETLEKELRSLDLLDQRGVDGIFICVSNEAYKATKTMKDRLSLLKCPYVLVDRMIDGFQANQVYFDNILGGMLATRYLIEAGHKKIGLVSAKEVSQNGFHRHIGFEKALLESNLSCDSKWIVYGDYKFSSGYQAGKRLIEEDVSAVFVSNDMMAYGLIEYFKEHGKQVPEDISVIGFDNLFFSQMKNIGLASVEQNVHDLSCASAQVMFDAINGVASTLVTRVLKPELRPNKSVKMINNP